MADIPINRAHVIVKYYLPDLFTHSGHKHEQFIKYIKADDIVKYYNNILPKHTPELSEDASKDETFKKMQEFYRAAFIIFADFVRALHDVYSQDIIKLFNIDINKYIGGYKIAKSLGKVSEYGTLFFVYAPRNFQIPKPYQVLFDERTILKIQNDKKTGHALEYEAHMQSIFYKHGLAPRIINEHHIVNKNHVTSVLVMEKYSRNTLATILVQKPAETLDDIFGGIIQLLQTMCKHKLIHGDLHWDNIGLIESSNPSKIREYKLLDFGQSTISNDCNMRVELLQLLRTINMPFTGGKVFHKQNKTYLENKLYDFYKKMFNDGLQKKVEGARGYEKMHEAVHGEYIRRTFIPNEARFFKTFKNYTN